MSKQPIRALNGGRTPQEDTFIALFCRGVPQGQAVAEAFGMHGAKSSTLSEKGSRLLSRPEIAARVRELLAAAKILDIDSIGQCHRDLLADIERARAAQNWTAVSQLMKTRASILGMLRDHVVLTVELQMSDQELIERLSRGDAEKAAVYRKLLGSGLGFGGGDDAGKPDRLH